MEGLQYGKYKFSCQLNTDAILPIYKGSTFRGVFGLALKKVVCALKQQECSECLLKKRCLYTRVFETPLAVEAPPELRMSVPPHPFVIEPPLTDKMEYGKGDSFDCTLLLMGPVNQSLPYFIYAFEQIGRIGIGRKINGRRGRFILKTVSSNGNIIYTDQDEKLRLDQPAMLLSMPDQADVSEKVFQAQVTLNTPLRLKSNNRITSDLPFHVLAGAMLRRLSSLFICYAGAEPKLDYKGLIDRAKKIKVKENNLTWHAWERYSNRQKQRMPLGGMIGTITYEGPLGEYLPLLEFCSKVHIGKNTSFGLGKMGISMISK